MRTAFIGTNPQYHAGGGSVKRLYRLPLALIWLSLVGLLGEAQTLKIRLLNGSNGKPIGNTYVNVWVGDRRKDAVPVSIGSNGEGSLVLTGQETDRTVDDGTVRPTSFPYAPEIRLQVGFVLCQTIRPKDSWLQITPYSTDRWAHTGIVTANSCGKAVMKSEPGVLTIFVRPLSFWEKLSE